MNPKLQILKLLLNLETYKNYRHYINLKEDKFLNILYNNLDILINTYNKDISLEEYILFTNNNIDYIKEKDKEILGLLLDQLSNLEINPDLLKDLLITIKQRSIAEKLALVSYEFAEGKGTLDTISNVYSSFENVGSSLEESEFVTDDLTSLYEKTIHTPGLRWRLDSLNKRLGSLRKGDFGFIFARPETGKTTFLSSETTFFAEQTDKPILWINNEEQGNKVMLRQYQACLNLTLRELINDRERAQEEFFKRTKRNIRIFDSTSINRRQIEALIAKYSPSLVLFDQIDKLKGFEGDREDLKLGAVYQWARELAKEYCPIIGVCQADGTGEGVKWLTMQHVANAKTSKQAEADFIIGIGRSHDPTLDRVRFLNISKNKLSGDEDTLPELRHSRVEVFIDPERARYRDVGG